MPGVSRHGLLFVVSVENTGVVAAGKLNLVMLLHSNGQRKEKLSDDRRDPELASKKSGS